ncbi:rhamnogalacturonan I rhamnosyltransferase 1-like isoform X2 [Solanum pennellii]|uniref:O-fucosyltransferase family protein n=1 Tax=Solanum pennellii TaxID=28526 RepID=A0ABM1G021_SOLPN|nr:rhamnogalacturonan I rhamnosyltransferase 1-like isoform X2 [Solanum pennellii]
MESMVEVRSERVQQSIQGVVIQRTRLKLLFIPVFTSILVWACLVQLWHMRLLSGFTRVTKASVRVDETVHSTTPRNYTSNGFLQVSCNGGLNQMRAAICDMVTVARLLNLTLVVPELDKSSFWADPSNFEDIFDVRHFIDSLRDEVNIIKRLPKKVARSYGYHPVVMPPVSWSSEKYYLQQILPLFSKHQVVNFNRTDTRLANNGIPLELQRLRCQVNFHALKFTQKIEALGQKLVHMLQQRGPFVALHLRYEMDMLAFSGCTEGCTEEEAEELKQLRYAFPWWKEKEIVSDEKRSQGLCPLTPEETTLILQALGIEKNMQIYIASGDIYGSEQRLATLRTAFPKIVKKEMLLDPEELQQFQNHSSQMAALDFVVSTASNIFIPTYDGNMAKLVEGHRIMVIRKPSYWIAKLW